MAPYHHMMAHFPIALMTLAFVLILFRALTASVLARRLENSLLVYGLAVGVAGGIAAMATGLMIWPGEGPITSTMGRNKILMASWTVAIWSIVLLLRWRIGEGIWDGAGRYVMLVLGAFGALLAATTGTLGGHLLGSPSRFSDMLDRLGWIVYKTYLVPDWILIMMVVIGATGIVIGMVARRRAVSLRARNALAPS